MSQKITSKRRKRLRIKRNKRSLDRYKQWLIDNPNAWLEDYKKRSEKTKQLIVDKGLYDKEWDETFCQPLTD
jgi:hypothetical protein